MGGTQKALRGKAKARAQTAADAAALAAAQEIAVPTSRTPADVAADYAGRNGATLTDCACRDGTAEAVVTVQMSVRLGSWDRIEPSRPELGP